VTGEDAGAALAYALVTNPPTLREGRAHYSMICAADGGVIDDLIVYRLSPKGYLVVANASNAQVVSDTLAERLAGFSAVLDDRSLATALCAIQGPRSVEILEPLTEIDLGSLKYYAIADGSVAGIPGLVARTGYTGEDGFELYVAAGGAERLWAALIEAGRADGIQPIGLGARDTLRLEMKYALYGNDIDQTTNPLEAGLGWVVKPAKGEFIGREAIEALRARGIVRKLVGFEMVERAVPRHGYRLMGGGAPVGVVTSGSFGPSVERSIGIGYVPSALAAAGSELAVEIRGAAHAARVVKTPFYPSHTKKA
jgi:aminomethyltransferase